MSADKPMIRIRYARAEAAQQLSISVRTLDRLREQGRIIARVDGGRIFFDHSELVSYAKSRPAEEA
ncbi:helix-turn-helix domain-containing protein [Nocardia niwae]|uniref:helix-turn-helix domain-containing protein n=1 Tax=Nocardia niwae TaxID=626084 RepID=UPI0033FEE519